jgi:hypothetical protein
MSARPYALLLLVSAIGLTACSSSDESAAKGAQIMAQAKAAMGGDGWDGIRIWHERGQAIGPSGETREYEHWGDLHTLGVRNSGPSSPGYLVFDGHAAYACADAGCTSRTLLDPREMRFGGYLGGFGFFFPERFPASFVYSGARAEGGMRYDVVEVTPEGLHPLEVWIDQKTHYVSRFVFADGNMRTDLSDYREVGGILVPFMTQESGSTMRTNAIRFDPPEAAGIAFTPPPERESG